MNFLSENETAKITELLGLSKLEVCVRSEWGSENPSHREGIQKELQTISLVFGSSSISHCPRLGGFAFLACEPKAKWQMGFDVEETARITDPVARRVCRSEEEFLRAPSAASLWAAKEASFKALKGPQQPAVISEIELTNWQILNSQFETYQLESGSLGQSPQNKGLVYKKKLFTFAFFVLRP